MKNLIIMGGTMGAGKTATCRELQKILPRNVFLDGDWCWDMHPFVVTDETKAIGK
jgi:tRNA uridine 5-carbamoylmethylation protein Kti12